MATAVLKTYKIYIGGAFPRTESGRYYKLMDASKQVLANICLCSRKDFRNAVVAARKVQSAWQARAAFNRGQIIYRIAEILEGRKAQFVQELLAQGYSRRTAEREVQQCIDVIVHYSGWCDKYQALSSSVNPVASSHFNFSVAEPMGVVAIVPDAESGLLSLIIEMLNAIVGGNTCVILAAEKFPLCAVSFAEVLATSDVPAGVVNILTGTVKELHTHMSSHMDVNAIVYCGTDAKVWTAIAQHSSLNVKRSFWHKSSGADFASSSLSNIQQLQETKTTWHPIEVIGGGGAKY
jgi:acyl-CoA reductase-like NAD-dependent aldehyde dehydrogenase